MYEADKKTCEKRKMKLSRQENLFWQKSPVDCLPGQTVIINGIVYQLQSKAVSLVKWRSDHNEKPMHETSGEVESPREVGNGVMVQEWAR